MKLGVVGAGYVGLTTAVCLASLGHKIVIYDTDKSKLRQIANRKMPFYESGLQEILEQVISSQSLLSCNDIKELVQNTDASFVCVGTPTMQDGSIDLSQVINASKSVGLCIRNGRKNKYVIIIRSTVIPGTTRKTILDLLKNILSNEEFRLAVVPEFLREGQALSDFMNPDKIVIGSFDEKTHDFVESIFYHFKNKARIIKTNPETAELIKYTNNAFFSMLISFANEIANISEKISGVDSFEVLKALVSDKRITTKLSGKDIIPELQSYLVPGCGFGGSCFPKDVRAIIQFASSTQVKTPLLESVMKINDDRPKRILDLAKSILGDLRDKKITILGLTFKPDTDDVRSSPALEAIRLLREIGAKIFAYDPILSKNNSKNKNTDFMLSDSLEESLEGSDLAILFTKWPEFQIINSKLLKTHMNNPVIIDGRGYLNKNNFDKNSYFKIGHTEESLDRD